jgi:hypothetical protein
MPSGKRRSMAGCCWSQPGRGGWHFCGRFYHCSRSAPSRGLRSTVRISPACRKPLQWRWCRSYYEARDVPNEPNDTPHSWHLPEQFGSVDRSGIHHSKHLRCGPAAPPSRPNLIVILLAEPKARLRDAGLALTRVPGFLLALLAPPHSPSLLPIDFTSLSTRDGSISATVARIGSKAGAAGMRVGIGWIAGVSRMVSALLFDVSATDP